MEYTSFSQGLIFDPRLYFVRVKSFNGLVPLGVIQNMYLETPINFTGLGDLVLKMNQIMDDWNMPQSSTQRRYLVKKSHLSDNNFISIPKTTFDRSCAYWSPNSFRQSCDDFTAFHIYVRYRQNSSWQGELFWARKQCSFRSVLELLHLLQDALSNHSEQLTASGMP